MARKRAASTVDDPYEDEYDDEYDDDEYDDDEYDEFEDDDEGHDDDDDEDDDLDEYAPREVTRTLSFGIVAMAPLFLVYEVSLSLSHEGGSRSVAEAILSLPLEPLGPAQAAVARRAGLAVAVALALYVSARREPALGSRVLRVLLEGAVGALLLGPVLGFAASYVEPLVGPIGPRGDASVSTTSFSEVALASGGAAFEEILFRILFLSLTYVLVRAVFRGLGSSERSATVLAAVFGTCVSALAFAAFHVDRCVAWIGAGGEPFDPASFTWRTFAGILLAGIVVWRGVGVAAWAHALFNLALILGLR